MADITKAALAAIFLSVGCNSRLVHAQNDAEFNQGMSAVGLADDSAAAIAFDKVYVVVRPHPEPDIERFLKQAEQGNSDAFAFIAFCVNTGSYAGFKHDAVVGKLGMLRAYSRGSAQAAFFIGKSFLLLASTSTDGQAANIHNGIGWMGTAAGMGESRAYAEAVKYIDVAAKDDNKLKEIMLATLTQGMEAGEKEHPKK